MFVDLMLRRLAGNEPVTMIDLCAAPGGKSTAARAALPEGSLLISNEPIRARAQILAENLLKWGDRDVIVTNSYPKDFAGSGIVADVILADVPCSGEGMFRKDDTAIHEWSLKNVDKCARLQREIVAEAWMCLKPGGLLIYSTCTFNTAEDEENIRFIAQTLGGEVIDLGVEDGWRITGSLLKGFDLPVYRFIPGTTKGEGLFMAALRKGGEEQQPKVAYKKKKARTKGNDKAKEHIDDAIKLWLRSPDEYDIIRSGESLAAIPKAWRPTYDLAAKHLRVMHAGIPLCEMKGKSAIPAHAVALSTATDLSAFGRAELTYAQAVSYLRKEAVALPPDVPTGYVVVTYKGVPLGFEKNIGNRANNLYPQEWRIKGTHVPDADNNIIRKKQDA